MSAPDSLMETAAPFDIPQPRELGDNTDTATSEALKRLTLAISNAVFNRAFENPIILDNLSPTFRHRCDSRRPLTHTLDAYLEALRNWPVEFPHWGGKVLDVSLLEMDEVQGLAEIMVLQHISGLQGPDSSLECSTLWKWRRISGNLSTGKWKATASYSGHHPLPDYFDPERVGLEVPGALGSGPESVAAAQP